VPQRPSVLAASRARAGGRALRLQTACKSIVASAGTDDTVPFYLFHPNHDACVHMLVKANRISLTMHSLPVRLRA
jgi:hypothetical protein